METKKRSSLIMIENKKSFDIFVQQQLNHEQQRAVQDKDGSFLVIAGAGSGKTRVITARITNLILHHNVEPSSIIALTFTNKAAQEMQHRITKFLPDLRTKPTIATFHAYCLKTLKKQTYLENKTPFTVIDAQDAQKLLHSIVKERGLEKLFNSKQLLSYFSNFKMNNTLNLNMPDLNMHHAQQFMELYNAYQHQKRLSNYLDFDDLLYNTYELFAQNPQFQEHHLKQHRHILIDEYQDTNLIQHELLKQMTLQNQQLAIDSVCAVGDEDQSIYSWRGATVKNILEFHTEFPNTKKIKLEQNYRSTQQILDIANSVIKHNVDRNHKNLWSASTQQHQPLLLECLSDLQEAALIAQLTEIISKKESRSSIAILYRTHYQSRIIEEALIKDAIPYKMIGGISFYERKEIKDLIAYLRLCINPYDRISLFRVINCPARGLGEKFEELFVETWNQNPLSTWQEISLMLIEQHMLAKKQSESLQNFVKIFQEFNQTAEMKNITEILEYIIKKTNYFTYLQDNFEKIEAEEKRENIAEFLRAAAYFQENQSGQLTQFLDEISLMQELIKQEDTSSDRVNMMTLHSAKGLEFNTVLLVGLEEGLLPSNQSIGQENVEEERRLFYVGITRAREKLMISYSKYRNVFGKLDQQRPSRFLREIPNNSVTYQTAAHWSRSSFATFFQEWVQGSSSKQSMPVQKNNSEPLDKTPQTTFNTTIKRLQTVKHPSFGLGIAHQIEQRDNKCFVTVHFTHYGTKKIESSFLEIV